MPTDPNNERYVHDFADGEYGWGEGTATKDGYQDIIDQLEHDVPVVAPESEIEQYRALPGRRFVAEDTTREYIGDGSAWVQVASRGPNPTFQSAEVNGPLRSGELSVGGNGPVTGLFGDSGDVVELTSASAGTLSESITRTSFDTFTGINDTPQLDLTNLPITGVSTYYLAFTVRLGTDSGSATATARFNNYPSGKVESSGGVHKPVKSSKVEIDPNNSSISDNFIEVKVSSGGGQIKQPRWVILGEIA